MQAAQSRIQAAVSATVDKVAVQLPSLVVSASSAAQRQSLMAAERDLRTRQAALLAAFATDLRSQIEKVTQPATAEAHSGPAALDWANLSLVDDDEVERGMVADRMGQLLTQACEDHLKSLYALCASLMDETLQERNPIRPQAVARALMAAIGQSGCDAESIQPLSTHLGRVLAQELSAAYGVIVQDMQQRGIEARKPGFSRSRHGSASDHGAFGPTASEATGLDFAPTGPSDHPIGPRGAAAAGRLAASPGWQASGLLGSGPHLSAQPGAAQALGELFGIPLPTSPMALEGQGSPLSAAAARAAQADFQQLLRQLAQQPGAWSAGASLTPPSGASLQGEQATGTGTWAEGNRGPDLGQGFAGPMMAVNMIRAHREELVRASGGAPLDQIVIDIVAALFDQVLSDPKVAPHMARQIARLQMPVLRVALSDMGFFNSRKHPVRRFVNRMASLSAAFESCEDGAGLACVQRVTALVDAIVEGDFDDMAIYEVKLAELERFIEEQTASEAADQEAVARLLSGKEADLRVQQRYMQMLQKELADAELPGFLVEFLTQIWSQVQVMSTARDGAQSVLATRMRKAGQDLALSVQPKGTPQLRKAFLMALPQLMRDLNEGLALIQWPEEAKQAFFAQLLPAHAECLKVPPQHELTQRMLEQRLHKVGQIAIPSREEAANDSLPTTQAPLSLPPTLTVVSALTAEEVRQAGFLHEAAITGDAGLDIELPDAAPADPSLSELDINLDTPAPPSAGAQLVHHIQKGTAYQMLMQGEWKKVRLTWVSDGRTFFIFNHGHTHKQTVSLTARTLARMCESGRFKAFEQAELLERATVRARRQLAALSADTRARHAA